VTALRALAWLVVVLFLEVGLASVWITIDLNENCGDVGYAEGWTCSELLKDLAVAGLVILPLAALALAIYLRKRGP
jgi:hypothetical protein